MIMSDMETQKWGVYHIIALEYGIKKVKVKQKELSNRRKSLINQKNPDIREIQKNCQEYGEILTWLIKYIEIHQQKLSNISPKRLLKK